MNSSKKRLYTLGSAVAGIALLLSVTANVAQAAPPLQTVPREQTVILDIGGQKVAAPDLWNPYVPGNRRDHGLHQSMMEPLFILNYMSGKIDPWLGASMTPNKDSTVWTLKLQPKATWSDGKPVTADDIIFTIDMLKKTKELSNSGDMNQWVKSMKKVDDKTVEFTLLNPNPRFQLDYFSVRIWGGVNFVPKHIWEGKDPLTFKNYEKGKSPVFSGPYKLVSFNADGTEFIYDRDDNWWRAKAGLASLPAPKRLIWVAPGTPENRVALQAAGKLDSLMDITLGAYNTLKEKNPKVIAWYDKLPYAVLDPCMREFEFNTTLKPWDDREMRWAMNYAIDRDQIVKIAYEGTTSAARLIYPMYPPIQRLDKLLESKGIYEKHPIMTHDPKKAMEMFEAKGYKKGSDGYYAKDGKQLSLVINSPDTEIEHQRIADVLVEQFQNVGVNASHVKLAGQLWGDSLAFGKFEARQGWQTCASVNEPWGTLDKLNARWLKPVGERADANGWRWENKEFSKLVDQMGVLPLGDKKVDDLFVQAMDILYTDLPVIPITQAKKLIPFDTTYWTNWPSDSNKYAPSWTWWQSFPQILTQIKPAKS